MSIQLNNEAIKVLLVEDNLGDARLLQEVLKEASSDQFNLISVGSLAEAVATLADHSIDVILLDLSLPDASGLETFTRLRADAPFLPIVILTGNSDETLARRAVSVGAQDYLFKNNLDSHLLKRVLRNAIERKRADQAQRENEERFRALVQYSTDIITILAPDGTVLYESPSLKKVMGYQPEEIQGLNITDVIHPDDLQSIFAGMMTIVEQPGVSFSGEVRQHHADGSWRTLETTMTNLLDHPAIHGIVVNSRDVTARRQNEQAIRFQAQLLNTVGQAIIATNLENKIIYWNSFAETLYGWSVTEAIGRSIADITNADTSREQVTEIMNQLRAGESWHGEFRVKHRDGTTFPVLVTDTPIFDEKGVQIGVIGVSHDISERKRGEKALQQSEQLLRDVLETLPVAVWLYDAKGQIFYGNPAGRQVWTEAKYVGPDDFGAYKGWWVDTGKLLEAQDWAAARVFSRGETSLNEEIEIECFDGTHKFILNSAVPLLDTEGQITGAISLNQDITERKHAENALRRYNQRLGILHDIDRGILTAQPPQKIAEKVAQSLIELTQCNAIRIIAFDTQGKTLTYLADFPPMSQASQDALQQAITNYGLPESFHQGEALLIDDVKAHEDLWVGFEEILTTKGARSWIIVPLISGGQLVGLLATGSLQPLAFTSEHLKIAREVADQLAIALHKNRLDEQIREHAHTLEARVTERTEQLLSEKERSEAILMSASDAMMVARLDGSLEQVNTAFSTLFGFTLEQGRTASLFSLLDSLSAGTVRRTLDEIVVGGKAMGVELVSMRQDGTLFDADATFSRVEDGQATTLICSIRDITERKRAEVELRQAWAKEKELNEMKTRFVSMVSHDFRTPLASIQSSSDLLQNFSQRMTDEKKQHHFTTINGQIKHLTGLLEDMLTVTQADSVGLPFHPTLTDLGLFCQTIADEMQLLAGTCQIRFSINRFDDWVLFDPDLLRRALINLLSNAVKYSPEDGIAEFSVLIGDKQIEICVKDQGIGIPEADQVHLFEVFHRASNVGQIAGTGLGLAIVKRAVEAHRGAISVHSEVGIGSSFTISLPLM